MSDAMPARGNNWRDGLSRLRWLRLEFVHEALDDGSWPMFKGGMWRGRLGDALRSKEVLEIHPQAAQRLFGLDGAAPAAAWSLRCPVTRDDFLPRGTHILWGLTLYGDAMSLAPACIAAARQLSPPAETPGSFAGQALKLLAAHARTPDGLVPLDHPRAVTCALDLFDQAASRVSAQSPTMEVHFLTPLDLRDQVGEKKRRLRCAPHIDRLVRAVAHVAHGCTDPPAVVSRADWPRVDEHVSSAGQPLEGGVVEWKAFEVASTRQSPGHRVCAGIVGRVRYRGVREAWPWLVLAESLQLGAGRHFGQGMVGVRELDAEPLRHPRPSTGVG